MHNILGTLGSVVTKSGMCYNRAGRKGVHMLIDLSCPAEVFQASLPTEEVPAAALDLYNLSDRVIVSVEATLKLVGGSGAEKERVVYRARALNGRPHSTFRMHVPCPPCPSARTAEAVIDKVWFSDNAVWRREMSAAVEYTPNNLPVSQALTNLRFVAGETAVGFPSQQEGLWVCVCGRPNPDREDICARCRRSKESVFTRYNREAVEKQVAQRERQLDLYTRSMREDTARLQRIREQEFNQAQDRKARRKHLALCLPLFLALVAAVYFGAAPALRLWSASRAMQESRWSDAAETLRDLGDFPGAKGRLAECEWQGAKALHEGAETADELAAAADALRALSDHPEAAGMAEEDDLARSKLLLEAGDREGAREALSLLSEEDTRRKDMENEILLSEARAEMGAGEYARARELFLALSGTFPEAGKLAMECVYLPACELIDNGQYEEAIKELGRIPEHPQSRTAILECHYKLGEAALEKGDAETAAAEFLMAADYGDAAIRCRDTVFSLAEAAREAGDTAKAQTLYASLPGYEPAVEKNNECILILAKKALEDKAYERAAELLLALPEGYPETEELIPRVSYLAGVDAIKVKDYEAAVTLLERAGDYRDAPSKLESALVSLTGDRLGRGDTAGALELLPRITHSKKYEQYKLEAEYQQAVADMETVGDPAELAARFEAMGDYRDAESLARRMHWEVARVKEDQGEILEAAREYAKAGKTEDAPEKAAELYDKYYSGKLAEAKDAMEAGDYAGAVSLLETLDRTDLPEKYEEVNDLFEDACVKAGETLYQAGRPYEAAAYFRLVGNTRRVSRWLSGAAYKIIGKWADADGNTVAEFREDSTCTIAGENFTFLVQDSYTLKTEQEGSMEATFRISHLTEDRLSLRDMREGREAGYELYRAEAAGE